MMNRFTPMLEAVQAHCRKMAWQAAYTPFSNLAPRDQDAHFILPRQRAGNPEQRADFLALIREWRPMLGARWENPLAWAQTFGLLSTQESTALTVARKLLENRRA